jgi:hypothetical protein
MGLVVKWRVRVQLRTWSGDRFAAETRVLYGFRAVQTTCRVMQFTLTAPKFHWEIDVYPA